MVKIGQTGLVKLNFETRPKKRIFRFLSKISAGHGWSWKFFLANFQILGPLGFQGWVAIPQNVKKSQNHCTLICRLVLEGMVRSLLVLGILSSLYLLNLFFSSMYADLKLFYCNVVGWKTILSFSSLFILLQIDG